MRARPAPEVRRPEADSVRRAAAFKADEFSTGRALKLREAAQRTLASRVPAAVTQAGPGGPPAVSSAAAPVAAAPVAAAPAAAAPQATQAVQDEARRILESAPIPNPNLLANVLREASPELRTELMRQVADSEYADRWLTNPSSGLSRAGGGVNMAFDDMQVVADAMDTAFRAGAVDAADLGRLAERLGPHAAADFVQSLALDPSATTRGGVVEALGLEARRLGLDHAAALAFSSSPQLMEAHLPTHADRQEAFGHVREYLADPSSDAMELNPEYRNGMTGALVNAARLSATLGADGFTDQELDELLTDFGPRLVGEAIGQAGEKAYNGRVPGPLDVLGDAAARLAGSASDEEDREAWSVNAAIAHTQSPALIDANLPTQADRLEAFDILNRSLAENRGEWNLATREGYSLVRLPQAVDGLNRLLGDDPSLITAILDRGAAGEADLVQLFESVSLNPDVPVADRNRLQSIMSGYVEDQLASVEPGNANQVGARVGTLLATLQVAADRAVASAEAPDDTVRQLAVNFTSAVAGVAARTALATVTGPLGAGVGGVVVTQVLNQLLGTTPPSQREIEAAFAEQLRAAGINVSAGERGHEQQVDLYRALHDGLTDQLDTARAATPPDEALIRSLETQLDVVQGVLNGLAAFGETHDSAEGSGELADELRRRDDEP